MQKMARSIVLRAISILEYLWVILMVFWQNKKIILLGSLILSLLGALSGVFSKRIIFVELYSNSSVNKLYPLDAYSWFEFVLYFCVIFVLVMGYLFLTQRYEFKQEDKYNKLTIWKYAALILVCWLPFFLALYPGSGLTDSIVEIHNIQNAVVQHPWLHCVYLYGWYYSGKLVGSPELGFALGNLCQMGLLAMSIAYCITWVQKQGCPQYLAWLLVAYYALTPNIANMSFVAIKDVLYSCAIMLFIPIFYNMLKLDSAELKNWRNWRQYLLVVAGILLLRNNGNHVLVATLCTMFIVFRKNVASYFKYTVLMLLICALPNFILSTVYNKKQLFIEAVGMPVQQIANIIVNDGKLTPEEEQFFNTIYPLPLYKTFYAPFTVDVLKLDGRFNVMFLQEHKGEFLERWLGLIKRYPILALRAQVMETYGFWSITEFREFQSNFALPMSKELIENGLKPFSGFGNIGKDSIEERNKRVVGMSEYNFIPLKLRAHLAWYLSRHNDFLPVGTCALILLTAMLDLYRRHKSKYILCLMPLFFNWLVMLVAAPIAFAYRYVFSFSLCLPLALLLPYLADKNSTPLDSSKTESKDAL